MSMLVELEALSYVWQAWRDEAGSQLEGVELNSIGLVDDHGSVVIRVSWSDARQVTQEIRTRDWPVGGATDGAMLGDDIVWALWANVHGTA